MHLLSVCTFNNSSCWCITLWLTTDQNAVKIYWNVVKYLLENLLEICSVEFVDTLIHQDQHSTGTFFFDNIMQAESGIVL